MFTSTDIASFVSTRCRSGEAARNGLSDVTQPRISVVMPTFNHAHFIERSLLSVINQLYPNTELIVVDGGSRDGTLDVVKHYRDDVTTCISEPDRGQSDALNKGFRHATGEIVGWLNSDDLYCPGAFHHVVQIFQARPEVQVVYGDWLAIDLNETIRERYFGLRCSRSRLITEGFFCNAQAMFWRKELHARFGAFDVQLHYTMDYDLMLRLTGLVPSRAFHRIDRPLGCFRVYEGQKTGSARVKAAEEHRLIARKSGCLWKYDLRGRIVRLVFRVVRIGEYWMRGGFAHVWFKLREKISRGAAPHGLRLPGARRI